MFFKSPELPARHYEKIVSLVPSITELLFSLGLEDRVAGITKFCVHPKHWLETKTIVGGTKNVNLGKLSALQPDLVICNKEENTKEQVEKIAETANVFVTDISTLEDALEMIINIGVLTNTSDEAKQMAEQITLLFDELGQFMENKKIFRASYMIWKNPAMVTGGDTFIHEMMERCNLKNVFNQETRYPEISIEELRRIDPRVLLLSTEPFPFKDLDVEEFQKNFPATKVLLADGEMFSWYGSRLLLAPKYFSEIYKSLESN